MTVNHRVWPEYNIDLALIEGTEIETLCGERFVPTVTVGTSGGAHVPGAPICEDCETAAEISRALKQLRRQQEALQTQIDGFNHAYQLLRQAHTLEEIDA